MSNKFHGDVIVGNVDVTLPIKLVSSTDGSDATGKIFSDVTAYYWRQGASSVTQITVTAAASLGAAHSDGKWWEVDATNFPGVYQLHWVDALFASGADWVVLDVTATGCKHYQVTLYLDTFNTDANGLVKLQPVTHTSAVIPTVTTLTGHTPSTGDPYAILNNGTYGNAQLVRSLTPANALAVDASNAASVTGTSITLSTAEREALADVFLARTLGTESYAALAAIPTVKQALYQLISQWAHVTTGTTVAMKKLDQSTNSMTFTLSPNPTNPTSVLRAS